MRSFSIDSVMVDSMSKLFLILFQLKFEAEVGTNIRSATTNMFYCWGKSCFELFHVVSNHQRRGLGQARVTLDMPAPQ